MPDGNSSLSMSWRCVDVVTVMIFSGWLLVRLLLVERREESKQNLSTESSCPWSGKKLHFAVNYILRYPGRNLEVASGDRFHPILNFPNFS